MTWNSLEPEEELHLDKNRRESQEVVHNSASFELDSLNIKGNLKVRLIAETFPKYSEFANVEIPIFSIIDAICLDEGWCTKRFPLQYTDETGQSYALDIKKDRSFDQSQPFIQLSMRLIERITANTGENESYGRVQIPSFSLSCIDSEHSRSVMLWAIEGTELKKATANDASDFSAIVSRIQVDNQLSDAITPVILSPTKAKSPQPVLRLHLRSRSLLSQTNLNCYETLQLIVQELDLQLEQQTVLAIWEMVKGWVHERHESLYNINKNSFSQSLTPLKAINNTKDYTFYQDIDQEEFVRMIQSDISGVGASKESDLKRLIDDDHVSKVYVDDFKIFPIKINVTFLINPTYIMKRYRKEQRDDLSSDSAYGLYSTLSLFLWQLGAVVLDLTSSISNAPIFFNGFEAPHLFKTQHDVTRIIQEHYLHSALGQLYKIVGSLDVVGNPIALISSLGVGVRDFFYEPAHALITSPTELGKIGKGFVKGTASLVSNTTVGMIGTSTTITRSIGRGILKLSMDQSYIKAREKLQANPKNVKETLSRPLKDIGNGFYYGITGVVKVPYGSIKKKGLKGVVPGVTKGIIGLAADPVVGILDAITHCGDAAREIAKNVNRQNDPVVERVRLSEIFGPDGRILPYSFYLSFGYQILLALESPHEEVFNSLHPGKLISTAIDVLTMNGEEVVSMDVSKHNSIGMKTTRRNTLVLESNQPIATYTNPMADVRHSFSSPSDMEAPQVNENILQENTEIENGDEEDDDIGGLSDENIIHTTILHKRTEISEYDLVVILTSKRIVVTERCCVL